MYACARGTNRIPYVRLVNSGLKDLIQFHIGAQETVLEQPRGGGGGGCERADYKSRGETSPFVTHRQGLIASSRDVKNYRPDRRCGSFRGRHAKTTMSNAPRSFTAHSATSSRVRLTQPGDPLHLLHGKSVHFRNRAAPRKIARAPVPSLIILLAANYFDTCHQCARFRAEFCAQNKSRGRRCGIFQCSPSPVSSRCSNLSWYSAVIIYCTRLLFIA